MPTLSGQQIGDTNAIRFTISGLDTTYNEPGRPKRDVTWYCNNLSKSSKIENGITTATYDFTDLAWNTTYTIKVKIIWYAMSGAEGGTVNVNGGTVTIGPEPTPPGPTSSTRAYIKINGAWKSATPYIKINGSWKPAAPHLKINGNWK